MTSLFTHRILAGSFSRASALCLLALAAGLCLPSEASAQWTTSGTNTTTTNNVGIGTTAPAAVLDAQREDTTDLLMRVWNTSQTAGSTATFRIANSSNTGSRLQFTDQYSYVSTISAERTGGLRFRTGNAATEATLFDRMIIAPNGNVGIGTASPNSKFVLSGNAAGALAPQDGTIFHIIGTDALKTRVTVDSFGAVAGPSVTFRAARGTGAAPSASQAGDALGIVYGTGFGATQFLTAPKPAMWMVATENWTDTAAGSAIFFNTVQNGTTATTERMRISHNGNVGVGTTAPAAKLHVAGDIRVDGNINAKYQDVAEWVPTVQKLAAGTVVVLDTGRDNHVAASLSSYDTRVAGVVSARPGISLGEAGEGKALVATTGRVKVRVDATQGPIKVGDLLVTSDREGYAMKSEAVLIGKRQFHSPGTIIGKALESLAGGTGEILVLLSLQ